MSKAIEIRTNDGEYIPITRYYVAWVLSDQRPLMHPRVQQIILDLMLAGY